MTTTADKTPEAPNPYDEPMAGSGKGAIVVPLILGGAIIVAVIILWEAHVRKLRVAEMARIEEAIRVDLRHAYGKLRTLNPAAAMQTAAEAREKIEKLHALLSTDYADLKMATLLIEGEAMFMLDCKKNAAGVEERFSSAIGLMSHSSGEIWQFGMMGRARARLEREEYRSAIDDLDRILDRNPSYGAAYYWRSLAKKELGDAKGAEDDARTARNLDSWPPLRDYMLTSDTRNRDILNIHQ